MRILSHHIGFYDYQPSTYSCLCVSESGFIAAGRCDGSLEVYQDLGDLFLISRIPPGILCSVESLAWLDKRLFTCGGSGALLELNIKNGQIKVGNDGGYISVIHATESELELEKTLPKLCGKVLCLALHKNQLAAGSNDGVLRVFNWKTSTILHSFNLDSCDKSNKPIIWCLIFARDLLFSGDSTGTLGIWNVDVGGLLFSFSSHRADILVLCRAPDEQTVFAAGVDSTIRAFSVSLTSGGDIWQAAGELRCLHRDIHGLVFLQGSDVDELGNFTNDSTDDKLLAVGNDARMQVISLQQIDKGADEPVKPAQKQIWQVGLKKPDSRVTSFAIMPFWPSSAGAFSRPAPIHFPPLHNHKMGRVCLLHYPDRLELVSLGAPVDTPNTFTKQDTLRAPLTSVLSLRSEPLQLAEIRPSRGHVFIASALSPCLKMIAVSDSLRTRILCLVYENCDTVESSSPSSVRITRISWRPRRVNGVPLKRRRSSSQSLNLKSPVNTESSGASSELDMCLNENDCRLSYQSAVEQTEQQILRQLGLPLDYYVEDWADKRAHPRRSRSLYQRNELEGDIKDDNSGKRDKLSSKTKQEFPSSHCLCFTIDSSRLLLAEINSSNVACIDIRTGIESWNTNPGSCEYDDHEDARVTQIAVSPESSVQFSLVGLAMSSGHVFVHRLSDGQSLFTCPRLPSSLIDGRLCPRIVVLQFLYPHHILPESNIQENKGQRQRLSILYTNGRLKEWTFPMYPIESAANNNAIDATVETSPPLTKSSKKSRHTPATTDQLHESDTDGMNIENIGLPEINSWLEDFFNQQSKYWHRIGTLHSMAYLSDSSWLLATESRIFILRMDQPYFEDTVALALGRKKSNTRSNDSLKMVIHHSGIIQCDVISPGEIAVVRVEPGSVLSKLPPPLYKKRFGF